MSLLIYQHYENQVSVYTDTLATSLDGQALAFCDKSFLIPHMRVVMAVTGILQVAEVWLRRLNGPILAEDIDALDQFATKSLQSIWKGLEEHYSSSIENTATVYHFGWSEQHKQYVRYIYRSEQNFATEVHTEPGIGVKPSRAMPAQSCPEGLDGIKEYAEALRKLHLELPPEKRIYIGGELHMWLMGNEDGGQFLSHVNFGKFEGYDDDLQTMKARSQADRRNNFPLIADPPDEEWEIS